MPAINPQDLNNAKLDVDHMAALATSAAPTATDRFGRVKKTWTGIEADLGAAAAITETGANKAAALAAQTATQLTMAATQEIFLATMAAGRFRETNAIAQADGTIPVGEGFVSPLADGSLQVHRKNSALPATPLGLPISSNKTAAKGNWKLLGKPTSVAKDSTTTGWRFSWGRLYGYAGSNVGGMKSIQAVTDLLVPSGQAAYIDLDEAPVGGEYIVHVSTIPPVSVTNPAGSYINDGKLILAYVNNDILGGALYPQYFGVADGAVGPTALAAAVGNRTVRPTWNIVGKLTKASGVAGGPLTISFGDLLVIRGVGALSRTIQAVTDLVVPVGQAAYVNLEAPLNANNKLDVQVTTSGSTGAGGGLVAGNFIDDQRVYLLINQTQGIGGALAATAPTTSGSVNPYIGSVWMKIPPCKVTFDPTTRTLAWDGNLLAPRNDSSARIRLDPASVTFLNSGYQVAYLDLSLVPTTGNTPASAIKFGSYTLVGTTQPDAYIGAPNQVPLFYFNLGDDYGALNGFPVPTIVGVPAALTLTADDLIVKVGTDTLSIYCKGTKPGSLKYLEQQFVHVVNAAQGTGTDNGNSDLWRLGTVYEATLTPGTTTFTRGRAITTGGDMELVAKEKGVPDYIGGIHGDEVLSFVRLLLDGAAVSLTAPGTYTCRVLGFVQDSTFFRCNTFTPAAQRIKHGTISRVRGWLDIRVHHYVKWKLVMELQAVMAGHLPIKRKLDGATGEQITDTAMRSPLYVAENIAEAGFPISLTVGSLPRVQIWGPTGIAAEVEVVKSPNIATRSL